VKRLYSLKGRDLFQRVYRNGERLQGKGFRIIFLGIDKINKTGLDKKKFSSNNKLKIGIAISKKYGSAPARNKAKRRIRAMCRELLVEMNEDFLLIIKPDSSFGNTDYEQSKTSLRSLLQKAGVVRQ